MKNLSEAEKLGLAEIRNSREKAETRFPLVFGLLATFGLVATLYGFEKLIDGSDWLSSNPWVLLGVGLATLIATGTAYRKLN